MCSPGNAHIEAQQAFPAQGSEPSVKSRLPLRAWELSADDVAQCWWWKVTENRD